jgi:hypothetical protein
MMQQVIRTVKTVLIGIRLYFLIELPRIPLRLPFGELLVGTRFFKFPQHIGVFLDLLYRLIESIL